MDSRRTRLLGGVALALVALLGATVAAPAVGGPKVLTVSKAKKLFLTKKKANKTFVTKAQAASFLTRPTADGRYLPRTGETRVPLDLGGWVVSDGTSNILVAVQTTTTVLQNNGPPTSNVDFFAPATVPTVVGGAPLSMVGLELCYLFTDTVLVEPVIDHIAVQRAVRSASNPAPLGLTTVALDDTGRVDSACTTVRFSPIALLPTDLVGVGLRVDYADSGTQVRLGAASLILVS